MKMNAELRKRLVEVKTNLGELSILTRLADIQTTAEIDDFVREALDQGVIGGGKLWLLYKDILREDIVETYQVVITGEALERLKALPSFDYYFGETH
jgi:hypothetical protein